MIKLSELIEYISRFGGALLPEEESEAAVKKLCGVAGRVDIHYLWSSCNVPEFVVQKKLPCKQKEYRRRIGEIFTEGNYLLAIDRCCFSDSDKNAVLQLTARELSELLTEY